MASDQAATLRGISSGSVLPLAHIRDRFIAVSGGKGGVGKSTLAVNLAVAYAKQGSKTITFDGDLGMADLNLLLGVAPTRSMADVLVGRPIEEVIVTAHGVHLLPALNGSQHLANLDADQRERMLQAVDALRDQFETIVLDTAAGIGDSTMHLAASAHEVIVVATPEPLSLADAYAALKILCTRHGVTRAFIAPNNVRTASEGERVFAQLSALVSRFLGITVLPLPAVPHDPSVSIAAAQGIPMVLSHPDSPASRAIRKITRALDAQAHLDRAAAAEEP